jgi:hypothetical protein
MRRGGKGKYCFDVLFELIVQYSGGEQSGHQLEMDTCSEGRHRVRVLKSDQKGSDTCSCREE